VVGQAVAERLFQYVISVMLRAVEWENALKSGSLTISSLKFEISTTCDTFNLIREITDLVRHQTGGDVIDTLMEFKSKHQYDGGRDLCQILLEAGFEPIADSLLKFTSTGSTRGDDDELFHAHHYDDDGILVVDGIDSLPNILKPLTSLILNAGKNASLLDRLGSRRQQLAVSESPIKLLDKNFSNIFFSKCARINSHLVFQSIHAPLSQALGLVEKYLLIASSGWYVEFMDAVMGELERPVRVANRMQLNQAFPGSNQGLKLVYHGIPIEEMTVGSDPTVGAEGTTMQVIKALTLEPKIDFPTSLVFTLEIILKLQTIFRSLSYARYVAMKLGSLWGDLQQLKTIGDGCIMFNASILLQQMIFFVDNYLFYVNMDIVATEMAHFRGESGDSSVDDYRRRLEETVSRIADGCFLNSLTLRSVGKVLGTCALFAVHMKRFIDLHADSLAEVTEEDKYIALVEKFENAFQGQLNSLLVQLHRQGRQLVLRLDFNNFYSPMTVGGG